MIDRIEVLKGPASALYGSDAVGGVVQIFTRKGRTGLGSFIPFIPYGSLTVGQNERRGTIRRCQWRKQRIPLRIWLANLA